MFVSHLYVFFGEMSSSLAHFLIGSFIFLELSCRSCLYIFEISSLSVASFAIIFSHSEGRLFNGGRAELKLADPANILTSGIDIYAQPPGKKLEHIALLSTNLKNIQATSTAQFQKNK